MFQKKNKFELIFFIALFSFTLSFTILQVYFVSNFKSSSSFALVKYKNKVVLTIDLKKEDKDFNVEGSNGNIIIRLKNHKISIVEENSKNHICQIQGETNSNLKPLLCLPNDIVITIVSNDEESVDAIIE